MLVSREPQDDGYTLIPRPEKMVPETNKSHLSLTLESSLDTQRKKKTSKGVKSQRLKIHELMQFIFLN